VNTPEPYERRLDRAIPEPEPRPEVEKSVDALAAHRDPSVPVAEVKQESGRSRPSVAWVRPSEMPTLVGSKFVGRGIDLQTELARRARRTPGAAASKAARRVTRRSIAQPEPPIPPVTTREGLGL
jgi:hypothetical protein